MRFRVTETRTIVVDTYLHDAEEAESEEDVALDYASDLPSREWDTLDRVVEAL